MTTSESDNARWIAPTSRCDRVTKQDPQLTPYNRRFSRQARRPPDELEAGIGVLFWATSATLECIVASTLRSTDATPQSDSRLG